MTRRIPLLLPAIAAVLTLQHATSSAQTSQRTSDSKPTPVTVVMPPVIAAPAVPRSDEADRPTEIGPTVNLTVGKSTLLRLPTPIDRVSLGNPAVADVTPISGRELYLLGKSSGSTNLILWRRNGPTTIVDVVVTVDVAGLQSRLSQLMPDEKGVRVAVASDAIVLSGSVSSAPKADHVASIANAFARNLSPSASGAPGGNGGGPSGSEGQRLRVINMLQIDAPQQVMLEVKVAEISKSLLDKLGVGIDGSRVSGDFRYSVASSLLTGSSGVIGIASANGGVIRLDAEKKDQLVRVLAEPNIMAISGQEASFLAGGTIFYPSQTGGSGTSSGTIALTPVNFGVGLRFLPTVLDGDRINLRVAPEVSEVSTSTLVAESVTQASDSGETRSVAVVPRLIVRRAETTVQLRDGQSFAIAGLINNNVTESIRRFPFLGELPILGALFRSNEFQSERTELMFIVTPRLVRPLAADYVLPTDNWTPPSRSEFFLNGQMEGSGHQDVPPVRGSMPPAGTAGQTPAPSGTGGFQLRQ